MNCYSLKIFFDMLKMFCSLLYTDFLMDVKEWVSASLLASTKPFFLCYGDSYLHIRKIWWGHLQADFKSTHSCFQDASLKLEYLVVNNTIPINRNLQIWLLQSNTLNWKSIWSNLWQKKSESISHGLSGQYEKEGERERESERERERQGQRETERERERKWNAEHGIRNLFLLGFHP